MQCNSMSSHHNASDPSSFGFLLSISPKFLSSRNRFIPLISQGEAYAFPKGTFFVTTISSEQFSCRVAAYKKGNLARPTSFHLVSYPKDINIICSKLNMASALACTITAKLFGGDKVLFKIIPPTKKAESLLIKNYKVFKYELD